MTTTASEAPTTESTPTVPIKNKVFIGNLSFKTTKESLTEFAETAGKVDEATVVSRKRRALGYGFITFASEEGAQKAVTELDKKELDGRTVHIELARDKPASSEKEPKEDAKKEEKKKEEPKQDVKNEEPEKADLKPEEKKVESNQEDVKEPEEGKKTRRKRQSKKKRITKTRATEPSKTTLFVANLPYATTDDDLKRVFGAYKLVSAQVSRMKNGRSKGYGFIVFETEEDQIKAFESLKDINLEGRAVYLKIALSEHNRVAEEKTEDETPIEKTSEDDKKKKKNTAPKAKEAKVESLQVNDTNE